MMVQAAALPHRIRHTPAFVAARLILALALALVGWSLLPAGDHVVVRVQAYDAATTIPDIAVAPSCSECARGGTGIELHALDGLPPHASGQSVPIAGILAAEGGADLAPTVLSKGDQLALNRGLGNAYRDEVAVNIDQMPNRMADTEVYKPTPFGPRFIDVEVSDGSGNVLGGIETKFGGSPYTIAQRLKDMWLYRTQGYRVNVLRYPG